MPDFPNTLTLRGAPVARVSDITWTTLAGKPSTLAGYGITDAVSATDVRAANTVLIGPASGGPAAPLWRSLVLGDLPASVAVKDTDNVFSVAQGLRVAASGLAAGLHVPWVSGDSLPAIRAGSSNASNAQAGVRGDSASGYGLHGTSSSAAGVYGQTATGQGVAAYATGSGGQPFVGTYAGALTTSVAQLITLQHRTSGVAAAGFGAVMRWQLQSSTTADQDAAQLAVVWSDPAHATRTSYLAFSLTNQGAFAEQARLTGAGQWLVRSTDAAQAAGLYVPWISGDSLPALVVGSTNASNTQHAISALASSGRALFGTTATGSALFGLATGTGYGFVAERQSSITNTSAILGLFRHTTSGTPAANFGVALEFQLQSTTTTNQTAAQITALWTDPAHATRTSAMTFGVVTAAGSVTERMRLTGAGTVLIGRTSGLTGTGDVDAAGAGRFGNGLAVSLSSAASPSSLTAVATTLTNTGAPTTVRANDYRVYNDATSGTITDLQGHYIEMNQRQAGAVTNLKALTLWGTLSGTGGVSDWRFVDIANPSRPGSGAITTLYGIYIADLTVGTTNYAIQTGAGWVSFGDRVGIGAAPVASPGPRLYVLQSLTTQMRLASNAGYGSSLMSFGTISQGEALYLMANQKYESSAFTQLNTGYASWMVAFGHQLGDVFRISRSAPGANAGAMNTTLATVDGNGNLVTTGSIYPSGQGTYAISVWAGNGLAFGGSMLASGSLYLGNQSTYYVSYIANPAGIAIIGNLSSYNDIYPGNNNGVSGSQNTSYYLRGESTNFGIRTNGSFLVSGDIYFGTRAVWLSTYLNQAVRTDSQPTFAGRLTMTAQGTTEGGELLLARGTSQSVDWSIDNASDRLRAFTGGGVIAWASNSSGYTYFGGDVSAGYRVQLPNTASVAGQGQANAWVTYSSGKLKDQIRTVDDARSRLARLRGVRFRWKHAPEDGDDMGMIAEEVAEVFPEAVTINQDITGPERYGLKADRLIAPLIEICKQQDADILDLKREITELRRMVRQLQKGHSS